MVETHRENPEDWRRQSMHMIRRRLDQSPPRTEVSREEESDRASSVLTHGQKRDASAMESVEDDEHFAGFTRIPPRLRLPPDVVDIYRENTAGRGPLRPPVGGSVVATRVCDLLPATASDGARKMLFEIVTSPLYSSPEGAVAITHLTYKTGLEYSELRGYAEELERLGHAERTSLYSWRAVHFYWRSILTVVGAPGRMTVTRTGPSGIQTFADFATVPSPSRLQCAEVSIPERGPAGNANLAHAVCETLPSDISVGAQKLLYELITRPQLAASGGIRLSSIASDHDLDMRLMLKYAEELRAAGRVEAIDPDEAVWRPTNLSIAL